MGWPARSGDRAQHADHAIHFTCKKQVKFLFFTCVEQVMLKSLYENDE